MSDAQNALELAYRLRREPDDVNLILPFDDVVAGEVLVASLSARFALKRA